MKKRQLTPQEDIHRRVTLYQLVADHARKWKLFETHATATCPFDTSIEHEISVFPEKGKFFCFTCHQGGDSLVYISHQESLPHEAAYKYIVKKYDPRFI